jgi:peptidoglycan hydrolase-like protein with peptidoglycan-binding domain
MAADMNGRWDERRRANEEDYFRKRDQELVERARLRAEEEAALARLANAADVSDDTILRELQQLGYTPETVTLLPIVPLLEVAWADGDVSERERHVIIAAARARGVTAGSAADRQMTAWLTEPPSRVVSDGTLHVLGAIIQRRPAELAVVEIGTLLRSCTAVAEASGSMLGFRAISSKEEHALDRIGYELERKTRSRVGEDGTVRSGQEGR